MDLAVSDGGGIIMILKKYIWLPQEINAQKLKHTTLFILMLHPFPVEGWLVKAVLVKSSKVCTWHEYCLGR